MTSCTFSNGCEWFVLWPNQPNVFSSNSKSWSLWSRALALWNVSHSLKMFVSFKTWFAYCFSYLKLPVLGWLSTVILFPSAWAVQCASSRLASSSLSVVCCAATLLHCYTASVIGVVPTSVLECGLHCYIGPLYCPGQKTSRWEQWLLSLRSWSLN